MSRRLLRACLAAVLLVSPVSHARAKPPDLPLGMQTPVGPMSDQESEAPVDVPPAVMEAMPPVPAPAWPLGLRPREQRQLKACLLVVANPLLVLTPLMDEKCDRGGDRPMTVINGVVCPAPVKTNAVEAKCGDFVRWVQDQVAAKKQAALKRWKVEMTEHPNVAADPAIPPETCPDNTDYVIESPDILRINAIRVVPLPAYEIEQIRGEHLCRPDGTIGLGVYGSVRVAGLTLHQASEAIKEHLSQYLGKTPISVDVIAYDSKVYYVIFGGGDSGESVIRLPITGNETVVDAISKVNGLASVASNSHMWIARPDPRDKQDQILDIDWYAINRRGRLETNYKVLPGDRIYIEPRTLIRAEGCQTGVEGYLARICAPVERLSAITLLGYGNIESLAPERLTVMPRPVTTDTPMTCPYLSGQTKPCPVVSGNVDLENSVLANLDRLTAAEGVYTKGQQCRQNGDPVMALGYFATVRKMVPGSNLDEMAAHAMATMQSATPKTPVKVIVTVTVDCGAERLHEEAVKRAEARAAALSKESQREMEIRRKLQQTVTMKYQDVPLVKVIDDVATLHEINIYIDRPALLEEGINLDCPVTFALQEVSLKSVLNVLLHQAKLTWVIKDEVLQITTERAEASDFSLRTYPIAKLLKADWQRILKADLPNTGMPQDHLIKFITTTINPRTWKDFGGAGTINYYSVSPGLVIYQRGDIHEQITDLLSALGRLQEADALARGPSEEKGSEIPDVVFLTSGMKVHAVVAAGNLDKDALERGIRVQMSYLQRACRHAMDQGRLDKAAELACETLALDESAHLLSFFGRVYLTHMQSEFTCKHASCKAQGAEEACEPADTSECPAVHEPACPADCKTRDGSEDCPPMNPTSEREKSDSALGLVWPVILPRESRVVRGSARDDAYEPPPPPCPVIVPWCPELHSVDIHTPINRNQIHADAPLPVVNIPLLILDEEESDKAPVCDPVSTNKHGCDWTKIMAGTRSADVPRWAWKNNNRVRVCSSLDDEGDLDCFNALSMFISLTETVVDGKAVDGHLPMKMVSLD